ncbi:unnamed protein product [Linum tenue]|uniref:S-protein homolog n=1 Tax=Linum tenue TaxID=586396 RepID=A0AAV0IKY6_9ROSI|nr:unnamed protein product [Linum tenue]
MITARKLLLLAAVAMAAMATAAGSYDVTIRVTNKLSSGMALILHCRSADDDLGGRALDANATYGFSFGQNLVGGATYFWCNAAFRDRRLSFAAFDEADHVTFVKGFDVSDDGVDGVSTDSRKYVYTELQNHGLSDSA